MGDTGWSLFADWHTHTRYSDGQGSLEENAVAGRQRGLRQVAITDHGPASIGVGMRQWASRIDRLRAEIDTWNANNTMPQLLLGAEANVISRRGDIDLPDSVQERLDLVIVSLHPLVRSLTWWDGITMLLPNLLQRYIRLRSRRLRRINTEAIIAAVNRHRIDFVAHPGLWIDIDTAELATACVRRGTALEINCQHTAILEDYVRVAMPSGVEFVINSDAHRPRQVGELNAGKLLATKLGLSPARIRNAEQRGERNE